MLGPAIDSRTGRPGRAIPEINSPAQSTLAGQRSHPTSPGQHRSNPAEARPDRVITEANAFAGPGVKAGNPGRSKLQERHGLTINLNGLENWTDSPLAVDVETQLLRIIQEALTNIRKHAGVDTARILFTRHPIEVQVVIIDEGRGFTGDTPGEQSLGLTIMQERAEAAGGSLEVHFSPGQGTQVMVRLPRLVENQRADASPGLRVLLVDDHPLYLEGMSSMLSTRGVRVIGTAHDGLEAVELAVQGLTNKEITVQLHR